MSEHWDAVRQLLVDLAEAPGVATVWFRYPDIYLKGQHDDTVDSAEFARWNPGDLGSSRFGYRGLREGDVRAPPRRKRKLRTKT